MEIDHRIRRFIQAHHVLTIAVSSGGQPWCASCYYVYLPEKNILVFTSDPETRHGAIFEENPQVAGAIVLETKIVGKIRGLQFEGTIEKLKGNLLAEAKRAYLLRFPVAVLMKTTLWRVEPHLLKLTDNRLGFGKKLIWKKD